MTPIANLKAYAKGFLARSLAQLTANFTRGLDLTDLGVNSRFTKPMAQSAWVNAAIEKVAGPITAVDLEFCDANGEIEDDTLAEFWREPALNADLTRMSCSEFKEVSTSWMLLAGEVFYLLDDSWLLPFPEVAAAGARLTPLIILRPDKMRQVIQNGALVEWVFTDAAGRQHHFAPDRIIHRKLFNPYDPWRGLGKLEAAMIAAGGDYAAGVFAKNTAEANGDQGVYVVAKGGMPDDIQREQIVNQLREKRAAQQRGIFRPAFLTGDITIEDPKVRAVDVAFISQRAEARKEIAIAFGVPPSFFDPVASYSVGSASDRYVLIEETCKPLGSKLCGAWALVASRQLARPVEAELDWDDHSVMQAVRRERIDSALKLWGVGMPMSEVSEYLSLDLPEYPGWDVGYLPFSVQTVSADAAAPLPDAGTAPEYSEDAATDPVAEMLAALRTPVQRGPDTTKLWKAHIAKRRSSVALVKSKFTKVLMAARSDTLRRLEAAQLGAKSTPEFVTKSLIDLVFDKERFGRALVVEFNNPLRAAMQTAGNELHQEIGLDDPWKMPPLKALEYLQSRTTPIMGIGGTVRDQLNTALQAGLDAGETTKELTDRVRGVFNDLSDGEAKRVAQTETNAAYNFARHESMTGAGIEYKAWLSSHGPNVRPAHAKAEEFYIDNPIPVDEPFFVGGEQLMYPGDPLGSPGNIINCQCIQLAAQKKSDDGDIATYHVHGIGEMQFRAATKHHH